MLRKNAAVPDGYKCPFCPDHHDDTFYESALVGTPICDGCDVELSHFSEEDGRRDDRLIDEVENVTGLSWAECRVALLSEKLALYRQLERDRPTEYTEWAMSMFGWDEEQVSAHNLQRCRALEDMLSALGASEEQGTQ